MSIIGIDYGKKYLGLAVCTNKTPTPLTAIATSSMDHKLKIIKELSEKWQANQIVVGSVSGKLRNDINLFIDKLNKLNLDVVLVDEQYSSYLSWENMVKDNIPQRRRKLKEHSYAAAILIERYLDSRVS